MDDNSVVIADPVCPCCCREFAQATQYGWLCEYCFKLAKAGKHEAVRNGQ
jgi:hypothetical protein